MHALLLRCQVSEDRALWAVIARASMNQSCKRRTHFGQFRDLVVDPGQMLFTRTFRRQPNPTLALAQILSECVQYDA